MKENVFRFPSNVYNLDVHRAKKKRILGQEFIESVDKLFLMTPEDADEYLKKEEAKKE